MFKLLVLALAFLTVDCRRATPNGDCRMKDSYQICTYDWVLTHKETMVLYDETTGVAIGTPVVVRNETFYKRSNDQCDGLIEMKPDEIDSVLTVDGSHGKALVINGQFPGPPIIVEEGTRVVVRVKNHLLGEGISIHWHGMFQRGTPWMDGVASISHCPINPGESFTYRFLATPAGTHWYHSHAGVQRTDGVYGALIVLEKDDEKYKGKRKHHHKGSEFKFEEDFLFLVQDYMGEPSLDTSIRLLSFTARFAPGYDNTDQCFYQAAQIDGAEAGTTPFNSGLINGKGWHYLSHERPENKVIPVEVFKVQHGLFYRFRLINAGSIHAFRVSIDGHHLHVISTDGNDVTPRKIQSIVVHTGERCDFYIKASEPVSNYWIRAETLETTNVLGETVTPGLVSAILRYDEAPQTYPLSKRRRCEVACDVLNCPFGLEDTTGFNCIPVSSLNSTYHGQVPKNSSGRGFQEHFLHFNFFGREVTKSAINGRWFILPYAPPATRPSTNHSDFMVPCDDDECDKDKCECTYFLDLKLGNVVQLVLFNIRPDNPTYGSPHPIHLHGHHFYVLKTGYPLYNTTTGKSVSNSPDIDCGGSVQCNVGKWANDSWGGDNIPGLNLDNPPLKDTVTVPVGGYVVIRFLADNVGWWFLHCHIEIHQIEGMALLLKVGDADMMPRPPKGFKMCGNFDWSAEDFEDAISSRDLSGDAFSDSGNMAAGGVTQSEQSHVGGDGPNIDEGVYSEKTDGMHGNSQKTQVQVDGAEGAP